MPTIFRPRINPALHRHPREAAIIGRIVVAFGELEFVMVNCAARALDEKERIWRALYRLRSTSSRIDAADAIIRPKFGPGSASDYATMITAVRYCLRIRNQYAHCNWADAGVGDEPEKSGLFFTDLEAAADADDGFDLHFRHIDVPLLEEQEAFFANTQSYLYYLEHQLSVLQVKPIYPAPPIPTEQAIPPLHNPAAQHVPPWLSEDQKALHLARARAANGGPPTPTPGQIALDKATAEKRARQQAQREKSAKGKPHVKQHSPENH